MNQQLAKPTHTILPITHPAKYFNPHKTDVQALWKQFGWKPIESEFPKLEEKLT